MGKNKRPIERDLLLAMDKDNSLQVTVFEELTKHIRAGYSIDCFGPISSNCIEECVKAYPEVWSQARLVEAMRHAKCGWESIGRRQADGSCLGNSRSWYYNMSNRYGWSDRQEVKTTGTQAVNVSIVSYQAAKPTQDAAETA